LKILGIDPGSKVTGFGLVNLKDGKIEISEAGILDVKKGESFSERLVLIFKNIQQLINRFRPDSVVVEKAFHSKNPRTTLRLGEIRGVVILASALNGCRVYEYTAIEAKQAITGYGHATKEQVKNIIRTLANYKKELYADASDAVALAICHIMKKGEKF